MGKQKMALVILDNVCVTLTQKLTTSGTLLPVSPADKSKLCTLLGVNHSYLTMSTPSGVEIVKVTCVDSEIVIVRAQGGTTAIVGPIGTCLCFKVNKLVLDEYNPGVTPCALSFKTDTPDYIEIIAPEDDECEWTINIKQDFIDRLDSCCPEDECGNCTVGDGVYENATVTIINGKICGISNGTNIVYQGGGCCGCGS